MHKCDNEWFFGINCRLNALSIFALWLCLKMLKKCPNMVKDQLSGECYQDRWSSGYHVRLWFKMFPTLILKAELCLGRHQFLVIYSHKRPLKNRKNEGLKVMWLLTAGRKYCRSWSILQYFLPALSDYLSWKPSFIFFYEWPLKIGKTVYILLLMVADQVLPGRKSRRQIYTKIPWYSIIWDIPASYVHLFTVKQKHEGERHWRPLCYHGNNQRPLHLQSHLLYDEPPNELTNTSTRDKNETCNETTLLNTVNTCTLNFVSVLLLKHANGHDLDFDVSN